MVFVCFKMKDGKMGLCGAKRIYICALIVFKTVLQGQEPLIDEQSNGLGVSQQLTFDWKTGAADRLLKSGLAALAEDLYRDLLQTPGLGPKEVAALNVQLAKSLIAQRQFANAQKLLQGIPKNDRTMASHLYSAISAYGDGRTVDKWFLVHSLSQVEGAVLPPEDLPWFYLMQGLSAELSGDFEKVAESFELARQTAVTEMQRAFFDGLILREELLNVPEKKSLIKSAQSQLERFSGTSAAYPFLRQYVTILHAEGQTEKAIEVIDQELATVGTGYGNRQREQLILLKSVLYGVDTFSGRDILKTLLVEGKNREAMSVALQLLAASDDTSRQTELAELLKRLIELKEPHPLLGQIYYLQGQIALERKEFALAETNAKLLLEEFPGLSNITNVYQLLAYSALFKERPQYRAAADFLIRMRDQLEDQTDAQEINHLIGDCYFLNKDYRNAVDFYQLILSDDETSELERKLFLKMVTAAVRSEQIDLALEYIDEADFESSIPVIDRWRAEWNVALALQADGQLKLALGRVQSLLAGVDESSVPTALDLRLRWLEARLLLFLDDPAGLEPLVEALLGRIETLPEETLSSAELQLLFTEVLLLKADILIKMGESPLGIDQLKLLRAEFSKSAAAEQSYLIEADYYASVENYEAAQKTLLDLASNYPLSLLVPQALYEAGVYGERLGSGQFANSVLILDDLTKDFPDSPLYFFARLKQGDLLRQMNDFTAAQIIYEALINSFPDHPQRYLAELSRAECLLALSKDDPVKLQDAALELERLVGLPNLPLDFQVEIGFKWGFALRQSGAKENAKKVFALISSRYLLDDEISLDITGRYWMSRVLLELGDYLVEDGEIAEAQKIYRKIVAYNLPGRNLAQSRANRLLVIEE